MRLVAGHDRHGSPDDPAGEAVRLRERRSSARNRVRSDAASNSSSSASSSRRLCILRACAEPFGASSNTSNRAVRELRCAWLKCSPGEDVTVGAACHPSIEVRPWSESRGLRMPCSSALCPVTAGLRESSRRCMPMKVMMKPTTRDIVFTGLSVLRPWKRMRDATMVAVEKQT
jgi:hypothetical protein